MGFNFWQKAFTYANIMALLVGLAAAFAGNSILFELHNDSTRELINAGTDFTPAQLQLKNFLFGIIGGTIVGFHLLVILISENALKKKEAWAWWACLISLVIWFIIDSSCSIYHGAIHNVYLINLPAIIMLLVPLFVLKRHIKA